MRNDVVAVASLGSLTDSHTEAVPALPSESDRFGNSLKPVLRMP
jgi:hypothetical protein